MRFLFWLASLQICPTIKHNYITVVAAATAVSETRYHFAFDNSSLKPLFCKGAIHDRSTSSHASR